MPISATLTRFEYTSTPGQTNFRIGCAYSGTADFKVFKDGIQQEYRTHYTITPVPTPPTLAQSGNVVFGVAPATGRKIIIDRQTRLSQPADLANNGVIRSDVLDRINDKTRMIQQEFNTRLDRAISVGVNVRGITRTDLNFIPGGVVTGKEDGTGLEMVSLGQLDSENVVPLPLGIANGGTQAMDAPTARSNLGVAGLTEANTFTAAQTIAVTTAGTLLTLRNTDDSAAIGPALLLERIRADPANNDSLGQIIFRGRDSGGTSTAYAQLIGRIVTVTDPSEDGQLRVITLRAGSNREWRFQAGTLYHSTLTVPSNAAEINATDFLKSGVSTTKRQSVKATKSADQSIPATTDTKLTWVESWDTDGVFASSTYTPTIAGIYCITVHVGWNADGGVDGELLLTKLYKNGAAVEQITNKRVNTAGLDFSNVFLIDRDGNDTFEIYVRKNSAGTGTVNGGGVGGTTFSAFRVE
jgi:hypothetical protein